MLEETIKQLLEAAKELLPEGERRLSARFTLEESDYIVRITAREGLIETDELRIVRRRKAL